MLTRIIIVIIICAELPVITSIYPNSPLISYENNEYGVPVGLSGEVVACAAFGWPAPYVEWLREGQALEGRMQSEFINENNSAYVSARLILEDGFHQLDAGSFMCIVRDFNNSQIILHSHSISINTSSVPVWPVISQTLSCSVNSFTACFKLQVLDTDCLKWDDSFKQVLISNLSTGILQSVISSECHHCVVTSNSIEVHQLTCSEQKKRAVLIAGVVTSQQVVETSNMLCALERWKQHRPSIFLNGISYLLDQNCDLKAGMNITSKCFYLRSSTISVMSNKNSILASVLLLMLLY